MTGRITRRGLARWAGPGGSERTVQRFGSPAMPGAVVCWGFFRQHVHRADPLDLLAGEAVVVTHAGKHPDGGDRFFARLSGKPGPGGAFFALARVSVQERRSFPSRVAQVVRSEAEKAASQAKARAKTPQPATAQRRLGRPKGRQHTAQAAGTLTPAL